MTDAEAMAARRWPIAIWLGLALCSTAVSANAAPVPKPPEVDRAELLYDTYCSGCHTSLAHRRVDHRAHSPDEVAAYVRRWSTQQNLDWSDDDVSDVTSFLVRRYYRFTTKAPDRGTPKP